MSDALTNTEKLILKKVFEGNFPAFITLESQIDFLHVVERKREYHQYLTTFDSLGVAGRQLVGPEENIQIEGTLLYINESDVTLHVRVQIINGFIDWLRIGGKFEFKNDFSIKEIFWKVRNDDARKEGTLVYDANKRVFEKAVSYIPMYR